MQLVFEQGDGNGLTRLAILVCCYNQINFISSCLDSINNDNRLRLVELIVIDDGSSDGTVEHVKTYAFASDLRVRIYSKPNGGLTESLRLGLAAVRSPFISLMAGDDFYAQGAITALVERLEKASEANCAIVFQCAYVSPDANHHTRSSHLVYGSNARVFFQMPAADQYRTLCLAYPKPLLLQSAVFSTALLRKVGAWGDDLVNDDWPTFLRITADAAQGNGRLEFQPDLMLSNYRVHSGGQHANAPRFLATCLAVAERVVPERYRRKCKRFIYSEVAVMFLVQWRIRDFTRCWTMAIASDPGPTAVGSVPALIIALVWKRVAKIRRRLAS